MRAMNSFIALYGVNHTYTVLGTCLVTTSLVLPLAVCLVYCCSDNITHVQGHPGSETRLHT